MAATQGQTDRVSADFLSALEACMAARVRVGGLLGGAERAVTTALIIYPPQPTVMRVISARDIRRLLQLMRASPKAVEQLRHHAHTHAVPHGCPRRR